MRRRKRNFFAVIKISLFNYRKKRFGVVCLSLSLSLSIGFLREEKTRRRRKGVLLLSPPSVRLSPCNTPTGRKKFHRRYNWVILVFFTQWIIDGFPLLIEPMGLEGPNPATVLDYPCLGPENSMGCL